MNKGFTLIEIIAVVAILALLLLVVVPSVNGILNRSKENLNEEQVAQIEDAARNWGLENLYLENGTPSQNSVTISTLRKAGFLEDRTVKSLIENEELSDDTKICITFEKSQYIYELEGDC